MLNRHERAVVDRMDDVLREMATLNPPNPANTKAIFENLRIATAASRDLYMALYALRCRNWSLADEHLAEAERRTARPTEAAA